MLQNTNPRTLRLLDFAEFIESLPNERINIMHWFRSHHDGRCCYGGHAIERYATAEQIVSLREGSVSPLALASKVLCVGPPQNFELFCDAKDKTTTVMLLRKWAYESV